MVLKQCHPTVREFADVLDVCISVMHIRALKHVLMIYYQKITFVKQQILNQLLTRQQRHQVQQQS